MDRQSMIEFILDHYERPRHRGVLEAPYLSMKGGNPGCGDIITLYLHVSDDEHITAVSFEGEGCTISQAAASMLTEKVLGLTLSEAATLDARDFVEEMGYDVVANRLKCATLALNTLKAAEKKFRDGQLRALAESDEIANF